MTIGLRHTASKLANTCPSCIAATDGYALALKLSAAAMFVGAILGAVLFEHVKFVPPEELALEAAEAAAGERPPITCVTQRSREATVKPPAQAPPGSSDLEAQAADSEGC